MNRLLIAAVVVILLAVAVMLAIPRRTETTETIERPNPMSKIDTERVTKVVLAHNVGKGDEQHKQRVVLLRGEAEGDAPVPWRLAEPVAADANQTSIDTLLKKIGEIEVNDVASESPSSHADLDVDDEDGIFVEVYAGDDRLASFVLGRYASGYTMMRVGTEDAVYRVRGSLRYVFGKNASDWRDKRVFDFERDDISEITFRNGEGTFTFTRDTASEDAEWAVASVDALAPPPAAEPVGDDEEGREDAPTKAPGKAPAKAPAKAADAPAERARVTAIDQFDPAKVQSLVTSVARLRCTEFVDDLDGVESGLEAPDAARVSFKVGRGEKAASYEIILGAERDKRTVFARRGDQDQIYVLTSHLGERLRPDAAAFQKRPPGAKAPSAMPDEGGEGLPDLGALGGGQIPPEVLRQVQEQLAREKMLKGLQKRPPGAER
jgi:hypothetical protein